MKITKATKAAIKKAACIVEKGGVIVYPTDTVYGLGCNPFNEEAVKRILKIKGERTKPLPILASDSEKVEEIAHFTEKTQRLMKKFWPGPLTIVLPKKSRLPNIAILGLDSVAVRVPNHQAALELIGLSGGLLVGTSANKTGKKPPRTALEAADQIGEEVDIILDDGPTPIGASSTVIDLTGKQPKILRQGPIEMDKMSDVWLAKIS
jgi:L-threonylcarbamoyladenylate synthase